MSFNRKSTRSIPASRGRVWRGSRGNRGGWARDIASAPTGPYGPRIDSVEVQDLLVDEAVPTITSVQYVASYNWLDGKAPIILVPGAPPAWTPPAEDIQLEKDKGEFFRDINAAHYSTFPMEPAVRSIFALQPGFDLPSVDLVGCGSTIGQLLRFSGSLTLPFRFDVDVIGDTVFFVRRGSSPTELIQNVQGYGHTFPDTYTTWDADVRSSVSHQRIISYELGGLRILMRTESDGYLRSPADTIELPASEDTLEGVMGQMGVSNSLPSGGQKLELRMQGRKVPQEQIFDIKTKRKDLLFDMDEMLPRFWLNQTPNFLLAYHTFGLFDQPKVKDIRSQVETWQKDNAALLGRFHAVLRRIVDVARDSEKQQLEISWDGHGALLITEQIGTGRRALPSDLMKLCEGRPSSEI